MTRDAPPALAARALTVRIGGRTLCRDFTQAFDSAQCWAVLGLNGAGKTTLIHTLAGVRRPDSGEILLHGDPLHAISRRDIAQRLALLAQDSFDAFDSSVLETALIGRHPHTPRWRWMQWESLEDVEVARSALAAVDLDELAMRRVSTLSGGERERLSIAAILTQEPRVILLDEPTSHLDAHHQVAVLELFARKASAEARTVVMSLHDASLAARYCTHALLMFMDGETSAGPIAEVLGAESLTRLYRHTIREINAGGLRLFVPA